MKKLYFTSLFVLLMVFAMSNQVHAAEAPYIAPIADQTASVGELFNLDINALNADPAETYELVESRPGMTINPSSGLISWTPASASDGGVVTVRAFNSEGESQRSFLVYLSDAIICSDDLISYWDLNETTGDTYEDFKGGYDATSLTSLVDVEGVVGRGKSLVPLGRSDQFMFVSDEGQYDFLRNEGFSVSLWFNYQGPHTVPANNQVLIGRGSPSDTNEEILLLLMIDNTDPGTPRLNFSLRPKSSGTIKAAIPNITVATNQWYHVVAIYDGSANFLRMFVNNQKFSFSHIFPQADFVGDNAFDLNIGFWDKYPTNRYPFNGSMDEILMYDKALSDSEVSAIYNDGQNEKPHCKPGNYFPLITSSPIYTAIQDVEYIYTFTADDIDGGPITLSAETIPDWLTFEPTTGVLSGTPDNGDIGDTPIKLKATDGSIDIFQEFTLTVDDVNDPPEFISDPITTATEETPYTYFVEATDPEDNELTYSADSIPDWLTFNPQSRVLIGIPGRGDAGANPVVIKVTDGEFEVAQRFTIEVLSSNNLPVFTSVPLQIIDNYSSYEYQVSAFDADVDDVLSFEAKAIPTWLSFDLETNVLSGIPEKADVGDHDVILTVTDGYVEVDQEFTITVRDVNTAPVILSVPDSTAFVDKLYTYLMVVVDHEGNPLTYSGTVVPDWMTFDPGSHVLSGTPTMNEKGEHRVIITVSDGMFTINHQFDVNVVPNWGVGIGEAPEAVVSRVYPNPAHEYLIFELNSDEAFTIELLDLSGKVVHNKTFNEGVKEIKLNVSDLNNGLYMYRIYNDNLSQEGKIVIK